MPKPSVISKIPVLRVLVPFVVGILIQRLWDSWWMPLLLLVTAVGFYLWLSQASKTPLERLRWRSYFVLPLAVAALSLGWFCAMIHQPHRLSEAERTGRVLTGRITNLEFTDFSTRITAETLNPELPRCKVLISTRGCDYTLQSGDVIMWPAALQEIGNMGNPDEMDYARYMLESKGIRYEQHLTKSQVKKTGFAPTFSTRLANIRRGIQLSVFNSRLSPSAQQFVVALLLGNSSLIDKTVRERFSAAGVAHVLALSGLHVGIIAIIIWWLLFPLDYVRLKKARLVITLAVMLLFAVFTGLSPSVVRATVMTGFVFASLIFNRRLMSLNALAMAALVILVLSPMSVYNVGFQLSFITVGAILGFARLPKSIESRHKWVNYFSSTVITSLVAMLATAALSAYYFHSVSLLTVISNLLILPVLPLFMMLGALFLLVTAAGMEWSLLDWAIDGIHHYIDWVISAVSHIPFSHVSTVYVSAFGVLAYFVILAFITLWAYRHEYRYLLGAGVAVLVLLIHSLWIDFKTPEQGFVIFNSFSSTPILYYDDGKAYVWTPDNDDNDPAQFTRVHAGFLARHGIGELQFITNQDSLSTDGVMIKPPYAFVMGRRILAVGSGKWKKAMTSHQLTLDYLVVTKRYHGPVAKLQELYDFGSIILSGAYHDPTPLLQECDSLHVTVHDLASQGAIQH